MTTGRSLLSTAQLADIDARRREDRPDITAMTEDERAAAGLMTRRQAVAHERLRILPHPHPAERIHGPDPHDPWAFDEWTRSVWHAWEKAGHYERHCDGWLDDVDGNVICATCLEPVAVPAGGAAA